MSVHISGFGRQNCLWNPCLSHFYF